MKYILIFSILIASVTAKAQTTNDPYADSLITLQMPQDFANLIGQFIRKNFNGETIWKYRGVLDALKPFIGSGTHPDSLFVVTVPIIYMKGALITLFAKPPLQSSKAINRILYNTDAPAIPAYTALATQVATLAAGNGPQKNAATNLLTWFTDYNNAQVAQWNKDHDETVQWGKL